MTDDELRRNYADLLDETDDPVLLTMISRMERALPRVGPPAGLMARLRTMMDTVEAAPPPAANLRSSHNPLVRKYRPVRRSAALAAGIALTASLLGGAVYAMQSLGGQPRPHVVQSCSGFGEHWRLSGAGVHPSSPRRFVVAGGRLLPGWRRNVSGLQRPRYWVTPANADVVDTCRFTSSSQVEIGTNRRADTQLLAISVVPLWKSNRPTQVGSLRIPDWGGCSPKPARPPITAPDGRLVAQLAHLPADLSR